MKKVKILFILLITTLVSCQQKSNVINEKTKINNSASNPVFIKVDTVNGKPVIDDRCGIDAPKIRISQDSLYYYYPTEGSYYKIMNQKKSGNTITYSTIILPSDENSQLTNFKITKIKDSILEIYIDNTYSGIFVNSDLVGKKIQIHHRKDCDDIVDINKEGITNEINPAFEGSTWGYDCKSSDYVAFTLNIAQFNFYKMDFGINSVIKKINEHEYELRFNSPPIAPIPEEMDWENYSKDEVIAKITYENGTMGLTWFGFYNIKTKRREYTDNPFTNRTEKGPIVLGKCD